MRLFSLLGRRPDWWKSWLADFVRRQVAAIASWNYRYCALHKLRARHITVNETRKFLARTCPNPTAATVNAGLP
jgi:hypothetical protein